MVTRNQIVNGVVKFIEDDMMKANGSGTSKFIIGLGKNAIKKNPAIIDEMLKNPIIHAIMPETDGKYDIEPVAVMLKETMSENGSLPLKLPKIPLLLPDGDEIRLNSSDVDKIISYIKASEVQNATVTTA